MTTRMAASKMELHALSTGREPRVATVTRILRQTLFRYQGHVGASLIVGGVDLNGPQLYSVHPHGSYSRLPFTALGERFHPFHTNPTPATLLSRFVPQQLQLTSDAPSHLQAPVKMQPWHCWRTGSSQT